MVEYIAQHWHFYQPRKNEPWTSEINEECYKPNTESGVLEEISFNIGPTLIEWFKKNDKETLDSIVEADSGQAIAQPYNHRIMPLIRYDEDLETQIIWGKKYFEKYFKRKPKGMWLPETATDKRVCKKLANQDIEYTIGAWHQKKDKNHNESPCKIELDNGDEIIYFFFDPLSSDIAYNSKISEGKRFLDDADAALEKIINDKDRKILLLAYDGETFGHHHEFADKWAAYFPKSVEKYRDIEMKTLDTIVDEVEPRKGDIHENSAWSCHCGDLSRWTDGCDCAGGEKNYQKYLLEIAENQEDKIHEIYLSQGNKYLKDVWKSRNEYIDLLLDNITKEKYIQKNFDSNNYSNETEERIFDLLKAEYHTQLSFTSCGWFFPNIHIQTKNNIKDLQKAADYVEKATDIDIHRDIKKIEWMLDR